MICAVCGSEVLSGKKFCPVCGAPVAAQTPSPSYGGAAPAMPQTSQSQPAASQYNPSLAPQAPDGVDTNLIEEILQKDEKQKIQNEKIWRKPAFWLIIAIAAGIPSLLLPWFHLVPGSSLGAFRIPLVFLVTGDFAANPLLSIGIILSLCFVSSIGLCLKKDFSATWLRAASIVILCMGLFAVLFSLRSWNVLMKNPANYGAYLQTQTSELERVYSSTDMFFGKTDRTAPSADKVSTEIPRSGISFVAKYLGPGVYFALLSAIAALALTKVFAPSLKFASYYIAPTPMSAIIVASGIIITLTICNLFFPAAWLRLGAAFWNAVDKRARAESTLKECVALPVPSLACEMNLGKLYYDTRRTEEAFKIFVNVSRRFPNYTEVDKYLGSIYFVRRNYYLTAHHLRKHLKESPSDIQARRKLSDALSILGAESIKNRDYKTALNRIFEAYNLLPQNQNREDFNYKISLLYTELGEYDNAAKYMGKAAEITSTDWNIQVEAAQAYERANDFKTALNYYRKCADISPTQLQCYLLGGDLARDKIRDKDLAIQWYQSGLANNDVGSDAKYLRRRIRELEPDN